MRLPGGAALTPAYNTLEWAGMNAGWRCAYTGLQNSGMSWYECRVALRLHWPTKLCDIDTLSVGPCKRSAAGQSG